MKKTHKLSVDIGISVFNEQKNISYMVLHIFEQDAHAFEIKNLFLYFDGCTDKSIELVDKIKSKKVIKKVFQKREGKPYRVNQIMASSKSDVLIILDADLKFSGKHVLSDLVKPFLKDKSIGLTSGRCHPFHPHTFIEKVLSAGVTLWERTVSLKNNPELYKCEGQIRAFSRKLYSQMKFPIKSADDAYAYLFCVNKGMTFKRIESAVTYYKLPSTYKDYVRQMSRYLKSQGIQEQNFPESFVHKYYVINLLDKIKAFFIQFKTDPFWTACYVFFLMIPKLISFLNSHNTEGIWIQIASSKEGFIL